MAQSGIRLAGFTHIGTERSQDRHASIACWLKSVPTYTWAPPHCAPNCSNNNKQTGAHRARILAVTVRCDFSTCADTSASTRSIVSCHVVNPPREDFPGSSPNSDCQLRDRHACTSCGLLEEHIVGGHLCDMFSDFGIEPLQWIVRAQAWSRDARAGICSIRVNSRQAEESFRNMWLHQFTSTFNCRNLIFNAKGSSAAWA